MLSRYFTKTGSGLFIPVVGVHGTGGAGRDVQRLLARPIEASFRRSAVLLCPDFQTPYQYLLPDADRHLIQQIAEIEDDRLQKDRLLLYGFSGGAQFCHRFAMRHPHRVGACVALASGCWTDPDGSAHGMQVDENWFADPPWDDPGIAEAIHRPVDNLEVLRSIRWLIGCGTRDHTARRRSAARFYRALLGLGAEVTWIEWDGSHEDPPPPVLGQVIDFFNQSDVT